MAAATVVALRVLPVSAANLSFPVHGIVAELHVSIGDSIPNFDLEAFCDGLGATQNVPDPDPSVLTFNSSAIYSAIPANGGVDPSNLMALRADPAKAALDKAIGARANLYWQLYSNIAAKADATAKYNGDAQGYLAELIIDANNQAKALMNAYGNIGVTTGTSSSLQIFNNPDEVPPTLSQTQSGTTTVYPYRCPAIESDAAFNSNMLSLENQQLSFTSATPGTIKLTTIWTNELGGIDLDVKRLQIAYINTLLTSPIPGSITQIVKRPGDHVKAGETVVRVEDPSNIFLAGVLNYDGILAVNSRITVNYTLPGSGATPITGIAVAVNGNKKNNEQWHVLIQCDNIGYTQPSIGDLGTEAGVNLGPARPFYLLPLHYSLDTETTTVDIQPPARLLPIFPVHNPVSS